MKIYKKKPNEVISGIPVFSKVDKYIKNYEGIANDHTKSMSEDNPNPFIPIEIWNEMELSTIELFNKYSGHLKVFESLKVLDVGVGIGRLLEKISSGRDGMEMFGMDIALPYLKISNAKGINVCFSKIEDMPYHDEIFDVILCTDVLEHVQDLNLCISKILSVLKRGGILIVRVPNKEDLSPYLKPNYPYKFAHLRNFDCSNLEALFSKIFPHEILCFSPGLFYRQINWLKYDLPFKVYGKVVVKVLNYISLIHPKLEKWIVRKIFHPIEMNVVVRKV